ncbi:hypothetical protein [Bacteroides cellulosilyticus]|uniref:hypothetical protein n=1 Tax=Bacteroides cellulosilyticus TaxID=246787 RepID=UPI003569844F
MKLLPILNVSTYKTYNHPPTRKEGGRMAIITRDVKYKDKVLLKKGTKGAVIAFSTFGLYMKFEDYNNWLQEKQITSYSNYLYESSMLSRSYDFFHTFTKNGRTKVGTWHTYISRDDFEFLDTKQLELFNKE